MNRPRGECFPKSVRLRKRKDFLRVQQNGLKVQSPGFVGLVTPGETGHGRVGITVTKRFGNAVTRNRTKRLIREAFRKGLIPVARPVDLVIIPKKASLLLDSQAVFAELAKIGKLASNLVERQS